jgi:hypothetical protein
LPVGVEAFAGGKARSATISAKRIVLEKRMGTGFLKSRGRFWIGFDRSKHHKSDKNYRIMQRNTRKPNVSSNREDPAIADQSPSP